MTRLLPHPRIALALLATWLLLTGSLSPGSFLLGGLLALGGSWALRALAPPQGRLRRLDTAPRLAWLVLGEMARSNLAVARVILRPGSGTARRPGFVRVPLDMRNPYGLAALACIITMTPGTVWVDHDRAGNSVLLHVLDLIDEEASIRLVKDKWERRLMVIFE